MASTSDIENKVHDFVKQNFVLAATGAAELKSDDSLTKLGLIDSTGVLELIAFIEETFNVTIKDDETIPANLDSLDRIAAFIQRKQAG
jgi:acyl carrier protein